MAERAKVRGHNVVSGSFDASSFMGRSFDLLIAFDVVEHLTLSEFVLFFESARSTLKPGGKIVLRFPNGQSPFFGIHQYGDVTHRQSLSRSAITQVCQASGFEVARSIRLRPYPVGLTRKLRRYGVDLLRDAIECVIGAAYYGRTLDLDPNQILLISRRSQN